MIQKFLDLLFIVQNSSQNF